MWILVLGVVAAWCAIGAAAALVLGGSIGRADRHAATERLDAGAPGPVPARRTVGGTAAA